MRVPWGGGGLPDLRAVSLVSLLVCAAFVPGWPPFWPVRTPTGAVPLATEGGRSQGPGPVLAGGLALSFPLSAAAC